MVPGHKLDGAILQRLHLQQKPARLLAHEIADVSFAEVVQRTRERGWDSNEHFSVDKTLIEAWASIKSLRPKDEHGGDSYKHNGWVDFHGKARSNEPLTDHKTKLLRKGSGKEAQSCFAAHAAMENRNGPCVLGEVTSAVGVIELDVAVDQLIELRNRDFTPMSVSADKDYHRDGLITGLRVRQITPHPALRVDRDAKNVVLDATHASSQTVRKRIEEIFGWMKNHRPRSQESLPRHRAHACRHRVCTERPQPHPHGLTCARARRYRRGPERPPEAAVCPHTAHTSKNSRRRAHPPLTYPATTHLFSPSG